MSKKRSAGSRAIAKAGSEYRAGDYDSAVATLAAATVDETDYLELAYLLGLCYARLKRYDEALLYLEQVVTQGEGDARALQCRLMLAYVYAVTGRLKLAEYELTKLMESSLETPQVYSALGHTTWKQGRIDEGLGWYSKALELDPENPTALNGYGYLLACAGKDLDKAVACCRKALNRDPGNPVYADSLGWVYFKLGRLQEAGSYLHAAAKVLNDNDEWLEHIAAFEKAVPAR